MSVAMWLAPPIEFASVISFGLALAPSTSDLKVG
jgi:hypothetical protein